MSSTLDELNTLILQRVVPQSFGPTTLPTPWQPTLHRSFTGFKAFPDNLRLVGQFLAWRPCSHSEHDALWGRPRLGVSSPPPDDITVYHSPAWDERSHLFVFSSVPGAAGPYQSGWTFDTSVAPGQHPFTVTDLNRRPTDLMDLVFEMLKDGHSRLLSAIAEVDRKAASVPEVR